MLDELVVSAGLSLQRSPCHRLPPAMSSASSPYYWPLGCLWVSQSQCWCSRYEAEISNRRAYTFWSSSVMLAYVTSFDFPLVLLLFAHICAQQGFTFQKTPPANWKTTRRGCPGSHITSLLSFREPSHCSAAATVCVLHASMSRMREEKTFRRNKTQSDLAADSVVTEIVVHHFMPGFCVEHLCSCCKSFLCTKMLGHASF